MRAALALVLLAGAAGAQVPPLGSAPVTAKVAARTFEAACLATRPTFAGAPDALVAQGFALNPESGTFYHPRLDLSVQPGERCSMVFGSDEPPGPLALVMGTTAAAALGGDVEVDPATGDARVATPQGTFAFGPFEAPDGRTFFRALLQP